MTRSLTILLFAVLAFSGCSDNPEPAKEGKVIVLMYHRITDGPATNLYERSAADFEADLKYLRKNKIRVIGFDDLEKMVLSGEPPSTDCAIITFDDGDHSWYTLAMPLLKSYRMGATFFLWALMIEDDRDSFLSWEEVRLMSHYMDEEGRRPFVFGSHTLYHQHLTAKEAAYNDPVAFGLYLDEEFGGSKRLIEAHTPGDVTVLSLPFGDGAGDPEITAGAELNGYRFIRTSEWGAMEIGNANLLRIPSLPMLDDTPSDLIGDYLGQ
ncbi:MAG: polysaccharide deacetylase family protein [Bacteroidales bacterium]|jgi:peptidoglycan/xylan/chitin deacetylase (PgdA/CDA1 family)|nr:polysaccharide deacetylase family protein [Bacteroidales bacterium]